MRAILAAIRPQYFCNILNLIKEIEIRTTAPKEWKDYLSGKTDKKPEPIEVFMYCTQDHRWFLDQCDEPNDKSWFCHDYDEGIPFIGTKKDGTFGRLARDEVSSFNGQVVAKFTLNKVEELTLIMKDGGLYFDSENYKAQSGEINEASQLDNFQLLDYLGTKLGVKGYAWHIDNLVVFDKPMELNEFKVWGIDYPTGIVDPLHDCTVYYKKKLKPLTRAPQSWCYVEV